MARVTCRCGETLNVTSRDPDRLTCSRCGAKIRVRRAVSTKQGAAEPGDGYVRFTCPCGRRLKVRAEGRPEAGKCPDCGRIVPVPESAWAVEELVPGTGNPGRSSGARPEARTADMDVADLKRLEQWASRHQAASNQDERLSGQSTTTSYQSLGTMPPSEPASEGPPPVLKMEAGLRVCPRCGKPLHMSATVCRACGEPVPKR
jgi:ribosomal protein L40E